METVAIRNLSFSYPGQTDRALDRITLGLEKGELLVLCGPSGCGKSTLLRHLKPALCPHGKQSGEVFFEEKPITELSAYDQAQRIGFVGQSPENQLVTDKVWHELAFGLESLGLPTPLIRRRVAEMASFFGIEEWFHREVSGLSGGQKQLLNLAAVMVMQPSLLILDEPTSQLDPIAAGEFFDAIRRINRELGVTVILSEHRLEQALAICTRAAVMDRGRLLFAAPPAELGRRLRESGHAMFRSMPAAMRIWAAAEEDGICPVTVSEGKSWLGDYLQKHPRAELKKQPDEPNERETVLSADELFFRYEKNAPEVVRGASLQLKKGELFALLGGNGAGKSTCLKLLSGLLSPTRGTIRVSGKIGLLPQNVQTLFIKKTVREDLLEVLPDADAEEKECRLCQIAELCKLNGLLSRHPYDLSGGEQQRAGLAKLLLGKPDILLLDEPTRGFDVRFKESFAAILRSLQEQGTAILMVSHDVEFCAQYAQRCALFFDGAVVSEAAPRQFFAGNSFYTTAANRIARDYEPEAVTVEDVIALCGLRQPDAGQVPAEDAHCPQEQVFTEQKTPARRLPLWRKLGAAVSGAGAAAMFVQFVRTSDLSNLIEGGRPGALAAGQLRQYAVFLALLFAFTFFVTQRTGKANAAEKKRTARRPCSRRTAAAAAMILLLIPLTLFLGERFLHGRKYYFISLLILLEVMTPFALIFEERRPQARELVTIAVLCALGVAGRAFFFMLPEFKPVLALVILCGVGFGAETGFLVGAMTMLVSNVMFSQGPWTPWQMFAMGLCGFLAGIVFRKGGLPRNRLSLCLFGAIVSIVLYGGIMNPAAALIWMQSPDWKVFLTYYLSGFPVDCVHAAATWLFLWFLAEPMLEKFDRVQTKYGIAEPE